MSKLHEGFGHISSPKPIGRHGIAHHWRQGVQTITCYSPIKNSTIQETWTFDNGGEVLTYNAVSCVEPSPRKQAPDTISNAWILTVVAILTVVVIVIIAALSH